MRASLCSGQVSGVKQADPQVFGLIDRLAVSLQHAVGIAVAFFLWFILPALPVILVARMSGLGARYPLLTRVAVTLAFAALFIWLMPPRSMAGALAAGWVFASGWFPRAPAAPSSPVPLRSVTHTS